MIKKIVGAVLTLIISFVLAVMVWADELPTEPQLMRVTCYCPESCPGTITASGTTPKGNYTCGARRDLIGCIAMVYECGQLKEDGTYAIGDFIGYYAVEDTGSAERIQSGKSIDIYQNNINDANEYIAQHGDYQFVLFVRGEG